MRVHDEETKHWNDEDEIIGIDYLKTCINKMKTSNMNDEDVILGRIRVSTT